MEWVDISGEEQLVSIPYGKYGFIYELVYKTPDGLIKYYIGQKAFYSYRTLPALKNGSQRPNSLRIGKNIKGKRKYFDVVSKESNWRTYESSSKDIPKEYKLVAKQILEYARSKRELTYLEAKYLFQQEVLEKDEYLNQNIMGKFFRGRLKE